MDALIEEGFEVSAMQQFSLSRVNAGEFLEVLTKKPLASTGISQLINQSTRARAASFFRRRMAGAFRANGLIEEGFEVSAMQQFPVSRVNAGEFLEVPSRNVSTGASKSV